jgi:hypothetical protein
MTLDEIFRRGRRNFSTLHIHKRAFSSTSFSRLATKAQPDLFKYDSPIFNDLTRFIKNNPINTETQREIERMLKSYSYMD